MDALAPSPRGFSLHASPSTSSLKSAQNPPAVSRFAKFPSSPPPSYPLPQIPRKSPRRLTSSGSSDGSRPSTAHLYTAPQPRAVPLQPESPELKTALPTLRDHLQIRVAINRPPSSVYDDLSPVDSVGADHFPAPPRASPMPPQQAQHDLPHTPMPSAPSSQPASHQSSDHSSHKPTDSMSYSLNSFNERVPLHHIDPVYWDYITDVVIDPTQHAMYSLMKKWFTYDVSNKNCLFWLQSKNNDRTSILMKRLARNVMTIPSKSDTRQHHLVNVSMSLRSSGCSRVAFKLETLLSYALTQSLMQLPSLVITLGRHLPVDWMENVHYPAAQAPLPLADLKAAFESLVFQTDVPILFTLYLDAFDRADEKEYRKIHEFLKEIRKKAAQPKNFLNMKTRFLFCVSSGIKKSVTVLLPKPVTNWDWQVIKLDQIKPEISKGSQVLSDADSVISASRYGLAI